MHYHRLYRYGSIHGSAAQKLRITLWFPCRECGDYFSVTPGQRRGGARANPTFCSVECMTGHRVGDGHLAWRGDNASYDVVHQRLKRAMGPASRQLCATGCGRTAVHWAYDHLDPNEQRSPAGPFSTDLTHYDPMCGTCHKLLDLAAIAQAS